MGSSFSTFLVSRLLIASTEFLVYALVICLIIAIRPRITPLWRRRMWIAAISKPVVTICTGFLPGLIPTGRFLGDVLFPVGAGEPGVSTGWSLCTWLAWTWAIGTIVCLARVWTQATANRQLVDESLEKGFEAAKESLRRLDPDLVVPDKVRVIVTPEDHGPAAWGVFHPVIVIPESMLPWFAQHRDPSAAEGARMSQIIRHELGHIQSWDYAVTLGCRAVLSFFWFHPMAHFIFRQLRLNSEFCADEQVLQGGIEPEKYANTLMETISDRFVPKALALGFFSDAKPARVLQDRVEHIFAARPRAVAKRPVAGVLAMVLMVLTMPRFLSAPEPPSGGELPMDSVVLGPVADVGVYQQVGHQPSGDGLDGDGQRGDLGATDESGFRFGRALAKQGWLGIDLGAGAEQPEPVLGGADDGPSEAVANIDESSKADEEVQDDEPEKQNVRRLPPIAGSDDDNDGWPTTTSRGRRQSGN